MVISILKYVSSYSTILPILIHYAYSARWLQSFAFLNSIDDSTAPGEYPIDGDKLFARMMSYETRLSEAGKLESHQQYADIQVCLSGVEGIDVFDSNPLTVSESYDSDTDFIFYSPECAVRTARVDVTPGYFVALWPRDAHRAQMFVIEPQLIKKRWLK